MNNMDTTIWLRLCIILGVFAAIYACGDGSSGRQTVPTDAPDALGSYGVGHNKFIAIDEMRGNRSLPVEIWYPVDAEDWQPSPVTGYLLGGAFTLESAVAVEGLPVSKRRQQSLLIFSHGYGGTNTQSVELMEAMASHGFIVLSVEHIGNSQSGKTDEFDEAAAKRVPDISFLIDTMIARNQTRGDDFYNRLDESRVGVFGHSFGGMTAIGSVAGWAGAEPDPRVAAIVPVSAVIDKELQRDDRTGPNAGFTARQLASVRVPVMLMGGTKDVDVFIENNTIAFNQLVASPRVYQVDIVDATHSHFVNVCAIGDLLIGLGITQDLWPSIGAQELSGPYMEACSEGAISIEEVTRLQNLFTVSFFRRHLSGDTEYDYYLSGDYARKEPNAELNVR